MYIFTAKELNLSKKTDVYFYLSFESLAILRNEKIGGIKMSNKNKEISEYLESSKTAVLATVDSNNNPNIRTIGGFGVKDNNV